LVLFAALTSACASTPPRKAPNEGQPAAAAAAQPPPGFTALFDGRDLSGFRVDDQARHHWHAEGGLLVHDGGGKNLVSARDYGDFELLIDWRIQAKGDSGLYLRGVPQVQIWDPADPDQLRHGADQGSGALWNNRRAGNRPLRRADRPVGEWNSFRVRMVGELVWVWLNGELVVDRVPLENHWDRARPVPARGPIELQTHKHPLWFRNAFVREIPHEEAVALLTEADEAQFAPLWNGRDFDGWDGPLQRWQIAGGAIGLRPGEGGTIFAREELGDFVARLEVKLPPGGNNGLVVRYPGRGDGAYAGMCELQVLDNEHPKHASLDPRQYHGSAYGMVAAHRGYLRPAGAWNFQQVTVRGSTIKVELNGTTILDTDLATSTDFMDGLPHPGRDRRTGFFGFAGHKDPVEFRNVRVRRL
jgi:hypothetical protein